MDAQCRITPRDYRDQEAQEDRLASLCVRDPARALLAAVIAQAVKDAHNNEMEARTWLLSTDCGMFCDAIEIPHEWVTNWVENGCRNFTRRFMKRSHAHRERI